MLLDRMVITCGGGWSHIVGQDGYTLWGKMVIHCGVGWSYVVG